ncbi:30S ribosomal protein S20 [Candidatus Falkowbacteria bacterium]|nr:30S ribosomal protein S20 [Candidatus Falkowbacteria bacterium]
MPIKKSAMKELRKTNKRTIANRGVKDNFKSLIKKSRKEIEAKSSNSADLIKQACKALDKAAQKGVIKKGNAGRRKSRLMRGLNSMSKNS